MALDFPSSPIDGQIYNNYQWSASSGVWKAVSTIQQTVTQSPLAPASPNVGDIWFNTTLGLSFTYYDDGTSKQWVEMVSSAVPAVTTIMPTGSVIQTARSTVPDGWLFCDGTAKSRTTYSALYSAIGTTYGSGDGSTTFNIPNLQGRVPVGKDAGTFSALGGTGGAETHALTEAQMPRHSHWISGAAWDDGNFSGHGGNSQDWGLYSDAPSYSSTDVNRTYGRYARYTGGTAGSEAASNGNAHNNLQPYIVMNFMIKV